MTLADKVFSAKKNRNKKIRSVIEAGVLLTLLYIIINSLFVFAKYEPYTLLNAEYGSDEGFVAISYFGVDRTGTNSLIGVEQLEHHLEVLKKNGFATITGKDIQEYYKKGKALPKHALYLNFEDGRRDTAVFAEKLLEKFNYHATISTYAENLRNNDEKFLKSKELKDFEKNGFWEMGTNGYRLYYINVFDRWNRYLGNMNPLVYSHLTGVLGRTYNHYLMDYIRDEKDFPVESYLAMKERVSNDYTMLEDIYKEDLGYVPEAYMLMHANTGRFGNNADVSAINEQWIRKLFKMNFNREGDCHNIRNSSVYDLTRMEPRAYWPANHLLMRIKYDNVPDICKRVRKQGIDLYWYIIGYGDGTLIRQKIKEAGMEDYVVILGKRMNPYPYMKACDIYAQPSRYEGKSVTVREAQMLGKPVVVTNYDTAKSQIQDGIDGVIVPMDNNGCAKGIADLIRNSKLQMDIVDYLHGHDYGNVDKSKNIELLMV